MSELLTWLKVTLGLASPSFLLLLVVCSIAFRILLAMVRVVPQGEEWTLERFGRFKRILMPGLNVIAPLIDKVGFKVSKRERVLDVPPQEVITKDNAMVRIDAVVFFRIFDVKKAAYEVENLASAITNLTMTNIRTVIGDIELDDALSNRDKINHALLSVIDEATDVWGVKIIRIEIKDITPTPDVVATMAQQMKAERVKRANILEAEGARESAIQRAQGEKEAAMLAAEGYKRATILKAEAEREAQCLAAEARERMAEAEAKATERLSQALKKGDVQSINYFLAKEYIAAFKGFGQSSSDKVIFMPIEATKLLSSLGGIAELAKETFLQKQSNSSKSKG